MEDSYFDYKFCKTCGRLVDADCIESDVCDVCGSPFTILNLNYKTLGHMTLVQEEAFLRAHMDNNVNADAMIRLRHKYEYENFGVQHEEFLPHCPACNSTKLTKISAAKKATKIGLFGIFGAGDLGKTYQCNNCGVKF